jgi:hypothetical protein
LFLSTCLCRLLAVYIAYSLRRSLAAVYAALRGARILTSQLQKLITANAPNSSQEQETNGSTQEQLQEQEQRRQHSRWMLQLISVLIGLVIGVSGVFLQWQSPTIMNHIAQVVLWPMIWLENALLYLVHHPGLVFATASSQAIPLVTAIPAAM